MNDKLAGEAVHLIQSWIQTNIVKDGLLAKWHSLKVAASWEVWLQPHSNIRRKPISDLSTDNQPSN